MTLVDAGPRWSRGRTNLDAALAVHGVRTADIELLVLTHHHNDHAGLAEAVQRASGCVVAAHAETAARLTGVSTWRGLEDAYEVAMLRLHGAGEEIVRSVSDASAWAQAGLASVVVDRVLHDGDRLRAGGHDLAVVLRPGHSPSDTLFVSDRGWALLGDHLLASSAAAVIAHLPTGRPDPADRPRAILRYRDGLTRTGDMGLALGLPGHGPRFSDPRRLVEKRLTEHGRWAQRLLDRMPGGPVSAWTLTTGSGFRPRVNIRSDARTLRHPMAEPYVALSSVLALLDLLVERGLVGEQRNDDRLFYGRL